MDLIKRRDRVSELTALDHDANLDAIELEFLNTSNNINTISNNIETLQNNIEADFSNVESDIATIKNSSNGLWFDSRSDATNWFNSQQTPPEKGEPFRILNDNIPSENGFYEWDPAASTKFNFKSPFIELEINGVIENSNKIPKSGDVYSFIKDEIDEYLNNIPSTPKKRVSINLIDQDNCILGKTINNGTSDIVDNASRYITNPIPIKQGDYLIRKNLNVFLYLDENLNIIPYVGNEVLYGNNRLNKLKITSDVPRFVQWAGLISDLGSDDMITHFYDSNAGVAVDGWQDFNLYENNEELDKINKGIAILKQGANLFNYLEADYTIGYSSTGASGNYISTGLMSALENEPYWSNLPGNTHITFWDSNKAFISGTIGVGAISPANTAFVSFRLGNSTDFKNLTIVNGKFKDDEAVYSYLAPVFSDNKFENIKWNVIGDSITSEGDGHAEVSYPIHLRRKLKIKTVRNYAISGKTFQYMADNLTNFFNPDCDICTVKLGTNDQSYAATQIGTIADVAYQSNSSNYPSTLFGDMAKLYHTILDLNNQISIGFILPIQRNVTAGQGYNPNALGLTLNDYVGYIKEFCEHFSIPYIDLYHQAGFSPRRADMKALLYENNDGTHPTSEALKKFVAPKVEQLLGKLIY